MASIFSTMSATSQTEPTESSPPVSIMSGSMNWEPVRQRLLGTDLKDALLAANELREGIEIVHTVEFPLMLSALLPAFSNILGHRTSPNPDTSTTDHKLRNAVLEIICRMPSNEILRPHAPHLVAVALDILNRDYEENALLASRIIFDLYKVYRTLPQDYVQPYLDFVQNAYRTLPKSVQANFMYQALAAVAPTDSQAKSNSSLDVSMLDEEGETDLATPAKEPQTPITATSATTTPNSVPSAAGTPTNTVTSPSMSKLPSSPVARLSPRSNSSFRVLTECPLIVMLMFQLYPKFLRSNIPVLINVMMEALALRAPALQSITQESQKLDAHGQRLYFSRSRELVAAQAKTLSFLTYLLRGFSNDLKPYEDRLASNVVALMSTCPREFVSTRKELLVATRHLLNSDFRNGFFRHVDALLDERVLIGSHHRYSEQTILRPLGYTTFSDLVHHVRSMLTMAQMSRVVSMFSRVLHDSSMTLPMSTQYTAVRTLLSIVDIVFHNKERDPQIGRDILVRILKTLVDKLSALKTYKICVEQDVDGKTDKGDASGNLSAKQGDKKDQNIFGFQQLDVVANTGANESLKDLKSMVRAIIVGHKTLIWYINNYRANRDKEKIDSIPPRPGTNEEVASAMLKITHSEHALIDRYIVLAFPCMKHLKDDSSIDIGKQRASSSDQYRDALTYFAAAFTTLDGHDLRRTLGRRLDLLVDAIMDDPIAIVVPRHLLGANSNTSREFCTMLLDFLVERIDELFISRPKDIYFVPSRSKCDIHEVDRLKEYSLVLNDPLDGKDELKKRRSSAYLQLFERVFKSLSTFPDNEKALRPHLKTLVSSCLRSSMEKSDFQMDNHCMLLRYIFRSISAGKFEESYKELLPLIPTVLNGLFRILQSTDDESLGNIITELLLTIPARLSSLLPHMNLLLRVITRALESTSGDLVNLGLRTLEFWVDNLNPEFLFPELSKQSHLFVRLMKALSIHLRPAPYPYGLLTLRLLGKLGGKNRKVLRDPIDIFDPSSVKEYVQAIGIECKWALTETPTNDSSDQMQIDEAPLDVSEDSFMLQIPLDRCVEILRRAACSQKNNSGDESSKTKKDGSKSPLLWKDSEKLWDLDIVKTDFFPYCVDVIEKTRDNQVQAAITILRSILTKMIEIDKIDPTKIFNDGDRSLAYHTGDAKESSFDMQASSATLRAYNKDLEMVGLGLMYGCAIRPLNTEVIDYMKGLMTNMFLIVLSHKMHFVRVDANGSLLDQGEDTTDDSGADEPLGTIKPFGYFQQTGPLRHTTDPMAFNASLAEFMSQSSRVTIDVGIDLLKHLLSLPKDIAVDGTQGDGRTEETADIDLGSLYFFENLLEVLIEKCVSCSWHRRDGLYNGICLMIESLGVAWAKKYETELMYVAFFSLKSVPKEMPIASVKSFQFFIRICSGIYGKPGLTGTNSFVFDTLSESDSKDPSDDVESLKEATMPSNPCKSVIHAVLTEVASTKQIVRVGARYVLKHYMVDTMSKEAALKLFQDNLTRIKRVLFSRSLRLLPLPEQIGVIEALAVIVKHVPALFPLDDQHLLAFLSELLKMASVADGEMTDTNLTGTVVDKNGIAISVQSLRKDQELQSPDILASALFLRRDCVLAVSGANVVVPEELPSGIQLRVSAISLLRCVIRGHADPFFDAESATPIGNIRPHVISLLFRSLVSRPLKSVSVARDALRDVLSLSVVAAEDSEGTKSKSRLRKELLQTCIRPVLLNLRDYTRLSPYLLRGLARLLSLLSSWFNKTLGEKLLDHLQKWTDPNRMRAQKIWIEGQEPDVAAAIIDLFALLPHASHFVEPLVKTTIKLEACLPAFKSRHIFSPYRKPLARYLNKHCQYAVPFFFQRLKTPLYSELFQNLIQLEESKPLREYLSGRQCSVSLLNICFERPLAIIRSEKTTPGMSSPRSPGAMNTTDLLHLHGIEASAVPPGQQELALRRDLEVKNKKVLLLQQEFKRSQENLKSKLNAATSGNVAAKAALDDANRKQQRAKAAFEQGAKEFKESKHRYTSEMAKIKAAKQKSEVDAKISTARPMNIEALELQHQGFRIVESLMKSNKDYLKDHSDVLRAFRWLWRSKGRYLRLQHEQSVSPRYHEESKLLASFLVNYSESFPGDVDLLFELIRIFLQSSGSDFSFVRAFLAKAVSNDMSVEQKTTIMNRFFVLLSGESTDEIKTLSVQLVVYPMLEASFLKEKARSTRTEENQESEDAMKEDLEFINPGEIKKFVQEILFNEGKIINCGDRLKIELLRLSNLFLQFVPEYVEEYGKDLIKFCWSLLKSDGGSCKSWAYLVFCRFVSVLKTPSKLVLQVYVALLRSHQQEGKDLVREALDLLVPALPKRLQEEDLKKVVESTNRIMFEEGNSVPQLAHIWQTIVKHPEVFYEHRNQFVRYMINSLNRLGLPPNCPSENRILSVSIVELVLEWDVMQASSTEEKRSDISKGAKRANKESMDVSNPEKKRKTTSGAVHINAQIDTKSNFVLDQSMIDTVANFIFRLKLLIADPKIETGSSDIEDRLFTLFKRVLSRYKECALRPIYLEKTVAMCKEENIIHSTSMGDKEIGKQGIKSPKSHASGAISKENSKKVSSTVLSACLDILVALADEAPENSFLTRNTFQLNEVLLSSFLRARLADEKEVREKLRAFVVKYLSSRDYHSANIVHLINVQLEQYLTEAQDVFKKLLSTRSEAGRHSSARFRQTVSENGRTEMSIALFGLEIIKEVSSSQASFFKTFTSSLLSLLSILVKKHISDASAKQKQGGVSNAPQVGTYSIQQMSHSPTVGIIDESYFIEHSQSTSTGARSIQTKEPYPSVQLKEFDQTLECVVMITEMIGASDLPYSFTKSRKLFFQIIGNIFDSSNNLQLLMAAVRVVGRWLLAGISGGPLTVKERNSFFRRITSFDFNGLPDVVGQPLADLVCHYVVVFLSYKGFKLNNENVPDIFGTGNISSGPMPDHVKDSDDRIMCRSLVACLLSANYSQRKHLLALFVSQTNDSNDEDPSSEIPLRTPTEVLWQLFHSDFEGLGGRHWVVLMVELLLAQVRSIIPSKNSEKSLDKNGIQRRLPLPRVGGVSKSPIVSIESLAEYRNFTETFLREKAMLLNGGDHVIYALRHLAHGDVMICQSLFESLFVASWNSIPNDGIRLGVVSAMESLLSHPSHSQFFKTHEKRKSQRVLNSIRSFLNGISLLDPLPTLNVDLLVSLAESYNCWYEVLSILEKQFLVLSNSKLSDVGSTFRDKTILAMRHCYRQLGESNVWMSLALQSCRLPDTKRAISLDIYGKVDGALEAYSNLVDMVESGSLAPPDLEMNLWEERWVDINRKQCQLEVVSEYANGSGNSLLMLESAWKQQDWDRVRSLCSTSSLAAAVEVGEPDVKMCETLLAVADGKLGDVENLHAQTAQLCLYKWQQLPDLTSASKAHSELLHFFHRLVEIRESGQIMVETSNHSNGKTLPDLKNLLNAWRHRLPNDYEELTMWDEVFTWRSHMFSAITSNFHWSDPSTLATLHDRPWSAIRMSTTARKHGMRQTSLLLLKRLTDNRAMDVSDAYLKLREQILTYNNPDNDVERTAGLNLINATNLSFFESAQKSELFRLKAIFLASLRRSSKSNQAYCHSVQICPTHAKSWVSWGGLCSSLGALTERQAEQVALKSGSAEKIKESRVASAKKVAQYLAQSMGCYLEAVQIDTHEKSRIHLSKCLWMLTKDGSSPGVLCQTLENRGAKLPPWVWLPWIPQLLTGLCRIEGNAIKAILRRLVKAYPQALYYSLRAFYLERRDVERAKGITSSSGQHMASVAHAEEMMSTLRRSHASLWSSLEAILEELIVKFRPSYEEELLATISALLERAESHAEKQCLSDKDHVEDEDAMIASWSKTLSKIAAKFFRSAGSSSGSNRRDERVKKTSDFKKKYKADFESDFKVDADEDSEASPSKATPKFTLNEYIEKLQVWRERLEAQVSCTPNVLPLVESSQALAMFSGDVPDLWPGACDTKHSNSREDYDKSEDRESGRRQTSTSSSASIARRAARAAAVAAAAAAAKEGVGGEYGGGSAAIEIPGQYCPNSSAVADVKPSPELHSKLLRFEPFIEVLRRNDQLVRRVGMVGSDGRTYRFLLQFAIPYWTRTDERTAQTHYVVEKFLRQSCMSARNYLSIQPNAVIPVAQRLCMTLDSDSRVALDDVLRNHLVGRDEKMETIPETFLKELTKGFGEKLTANITPEEKKSMEKAVRLDVYNQICNSKIGKNVLLHHIQSMLDGPEPFYHFRRAFAGQLAANSLLQYIFSVAERTPQRLVFLLSNGRVLSPDFRVSYTKQGFIEVQEVPYRMTPNVESLIGKPYLDGRFIKAMAMIASAIYEHRDEFDPVLRLLMRDDILAWYSKSLDLLSRSDSKTQELERQLSERVSKNVSTLQSRVAECAPSRNSTGKDPIDVRVQDLYKAAASPDKLCMMSTNYHAWF